MPRWGHEGEGQDVDKALESFSVKICGKSHSYGSKQGLG